MPHPEGHKASYRAQAGTGISKSVGDNCVRGKKNYFFFLNEGAGFFQMSATEDEFVHSC